MYILGYATSSESARNLDDRSWSNAYDFRNENAENVHEVPRKNRIVRHHTSSVLEVALL